MRMFLMTAGAFVVAAAAGSGVSDAEMRRVYDEVKTPVKRGVVLRSGRKGWMVDSPGVFRCGDKWRMFYLLFDGEGYETHVAESADLLTWEKLGAVLTRPRAGWDAEQADGFPALADPVWGGSHALQPFDGKYWMTYLGGARKGYETDPLSIGVAWAESAGWTGAWTRHPKPVLTPGDADARAFEKLTLYKSNVVRDPDRRLGAPFVMFYNCKARTGHERIATALSDDMVTWRRHGAEPVVDHGHGISGDPQLVRMGELWVMFYFGAFWKDKPYGAFDTFACSKDLTYWRTWDGPDLIAPSEPYDAQFAHKPWVVKHDGVVYHFYCAVGNQGRVIAVATSK